MILLPEPTDRSAKEIWHDLVQRTQNEPAPSNQLDFELLYALGRSTVQFKVLSQSYETAAAFVRAELPDWGYRLQYHPTYSAGNRYVVTLQCPPVDPNGSITDGNSWSRKYDGKGHTEAWAMLSAFCQAKYERE